MQFDFDSPLDRRGSDSYKWDANAEQFGRAELLPLWMADMDFACPEPIISALQQRLQHPVLGYTLRSQAYRQSLLDWLLQRHNWQVAPETLVFAPPGAIYAINTLVQLLTEPGDEILVQTPIYQPLLNLVRDNARQPVANPLVLEQGVYRFDIEQLQRCLSPRTKMLLLCSPHNPTGRVWTHAELREIAELCRQHNLIVIADEVHGDLLYPGVRHTPFGSLGDQLAERSITLVSPSKTFNTSGLPQCSLVIPDAELRAAFTVALDVSQLNLDNTLAAVAMQAGYQHCGDWLDQLMAYVAANFNYMQAFFEQRLPRLKCIVPQGTYLAWLDFRNFQLPQEQLMRSLVEQGVGLYSGTEFGADGQGFCRINLACPRALLEQGLVMIYAALSEVGSE